MLDRIQTAQQLEKIIKNASEGKNTKFLNSAHSLWYRFKNYDKHPPFVLNVNNDPVAFVFATYSKRSKYINLYEIVTMQGQEGNGYASKIWDLVMLDAYENGMHRLKISCTPDSVTWHNRNGLIFWGVDPSGSLRSDQPLFPSSLAQNNFRTKAIRDPKLALPTDSKVLERLASESVEKHKFGSKKTKQVRTAIEQVGDAWMRDSLLIDQATLEEFF